ncbi:MAG: RNA polymerase sigma factor [Actinomycetes bacterium]
MAGQRPLLERAAAGDREAFARLFEDQVEGVYRYLLAWTGDRAEAAELTGQVFRDALGWLPATAGGEVEAGAWLIAMARDAVAQRRESGWIAGPAGPGGPSASATDAVAAVARLGDPEREVVVLRLLLGHSLAHTAHLSGYSRRAVLELQLAACLAVWELTGGSRAGPGPATRAAPSAEEFERRLGSWEIDTAGSDPALANALAAAGSLRRAIPGYVIAPDDELVQRLRVELVAGAPRAEWAMDDREHLPLGLGPAVDNPAVDNPAPIPPRWATPPDRGPQEPGVADSAARPSERPEAADSAAPPSTKPPPPADPTAAAAPAEAARRHWVATAVAAAGIVLVLALQVLSRPGPSSGCGDRPCPVPTTGVVAAPGGGSLAPTPTTVLRSSSTSSTVGDLTPAPTVPETSAATTPPSTRPPTSAVETTRAPRPPTTTRAPTTTAAPPTTLSATTTTAAPAPG